MAVRPKALATYADLRDYAGNAAEVSLTSARIAGIFVRDDGDMTSADNDGTIIVASNGRRWKRRVDGKIKVGWFGAIGAGADDTVAWNNAVAVLVSLGGGILEAIPDTVHVLSDQIYCDPSVPVTVDLMGATLKLEATVGNFKRIFTTANATGRLVYSSAEDSPAWVFRNGILDLSRENRLPYARYEKENSAAFFWGASATYPGRARLVVEDSIMIQNSTGDGVHVYTNAHVTMRGKTRRCFRGGLTVTGGYSVVDGDNMMDLGGTNSLGIHIEIDAFGYGATKRMVGTFRGANVAGGVTLDPTQGSVIDISGITMTGGGLTISGGDGTGTIVGVGSTLTVAGQGGATGYFGNCKIIHLINPTITVVFSGAGGQTIAAVAPRFGLGGAVGSDKAIILESPTFLTKNKQATDRAIAISCPAMSSATNNWVRLHGGKITSTYDAGIVAVQGGCYEIDGDVEFSSTTTAFHISGTKSYLARLRLGRYRNTGGGEEKIGTMVDVLAI
ncbi:hypothetical protein P3W85_00925 [Cupriavidus basilensis]|uniref:Uncharacterized protein n=1 Tax=Cupriavidus basilensis TaxID=68895 RepID=A0ABT6AG02_9BURK|nr:hypothetical protein [Cupriavidus basilensis]MDF3831531.1 hypothetical protein [Cupriavidus basilensis]